MFETKGRTFGEMDYMVSDMPKSRRIFVNSLIVPEGRPGSEVCQLQD